MSRAGSHPIIVFGDDWGRHVSSLQHVFRVIAGRRRVIWVNAIGHRVPRLRVGDLRRAWEKGRAMMRRGPLEPTVDGGFGHAPELVVQPRVLPWHHRSLVLALNTRSLLRSIRRALNTQRAGASPILVTGSPPSVPVIGRVGEVASVYFCMDDFSHLAGVSPKMLEPLERRLLQKVDAVVATAISLTRSKVPGSGRVHYLPQGVNYDHFATPRSEPAELRKLPRPILGFAGGVSECCDLDLIRRIADAYPRASIVLVGPVTVDTSPLDRPNVHLLGARSYRDLPAYVQRFDVGLIPYLLNGWTRAVDPLKLLEYLAAGIPVVSTAIPEVKKYRDVIGIASGKSEMLAEISSALSADRSSVRVRAQRLARRNTWDARADRLLGIIDEIVERRARCLGVGVP